MRSTVLSFLLLTLLAPAASAADGLALEVALAGEAVAHEEIVTYTVRFVNRGEKEVRFFVPLFAGRNSFPSIRFVRLSDGREFLPYDEAFQTMVRSGLQGEIATLEPGGKREFRYGEDRFLPLNPETGRADGMEAAPLPSGEYRVVAVYARPDNRVPFNVGGFDVELWPVEGLFTGRIEAAAAKLTVGKPTRPRIVISAPSKDGAELAVAFENPSGEAVVFEGAPRLELVSKMYGAATSTPAIVRDGDAADGEMLRVAVPAGGERKVRLDLRALNWLRTGRRDRGPAGLAEIVPRGLVHLRLALLDGEREAAVSNGILARIPSPPRAGLEGLVVTATLSKRHARPGESVRLAMRVANSCGKDLLVVHRLSFPKEFVVRIEDAAGRRRLRGAVTQKASSGFDSLIPRGDEEAKLVEPLSWNGDRYDPAPGLTSRDFVLLEPGGGMEKEIDLAARLADGFTPGAYRIHVGYRNLESGARLGFPAERRAGTGTVWSKPVELVVE